MTCKQLGGACDTEFHANTFKEIAQKSRKHGMEMAKKGDKAHIEAMEEMKEKSEKEMNEWMEKKKEEFEALPNK